MSSDKQEGAVRRILVALDASQEGLVALEAAAEMASRLEVELLGLFVEDIDVMNLAALPFAREVSLSSRTARVMDPQTIERELKAQAALARQALATAAESLNVPWSFRIARGRMAAELLAAAVEADLVAMSRRSGAVGGPAKVGQVARDVAAGAVRSILLAAPDRHGRHARIALPYDASAAAETALRTAIRLAGRDDSPLTVFVRAQDAAMADSREALLSNRLHRLAMPVAIRRVIGAGLAGLVEAIEAERTRLLVLGLDAPWPGPADVSELVERVSCSLLLVRPGP